MSSFELPPLTKIFPTGAHSRHKFAKVVKLLFEAEARETREFQVTDFNDSSGDINGADIILNKGFAETGKKILIQLKFYSTPLVKGT